MMTGLKMTVVLGMCGLLFATGCYNPPVERMHGRNELKAGDYAAARSRAQALIAHNPADWEAHYILGRAHLGEGNPVKAQSELEQALAARDRDSTDTPKILDALAESLHQQGRYTDLTTFLDEQIERYEGWRDYARKARFLAKAKDVDGAALAYKQAAFFSRNETEDIYIEIADFYHDLGKYEIELQALKWAYYINDKNPELPKRFEKLGYVPGPTLKERPPQPNTPGGGLFN